MEEESFDDPEIAQLLNQHFIADQGGPRGAPGRRRGLHERGPGDDGRRRLALERLADSGAEAVLRRDLLSARATAVPITGFRRCCRRCSSTTRRTAGDSSRLRISSPSSSSGTSRPPRLPGRTSRTRTCCAWPSPGTPETPTVPGEDSPSQMKFPASFPVRFLLRFHRRTGDPDALRARHAHPREDGGRRHLRPGRRRLPPLLHRSALAGAALREDALRQRAARL